MSKWADYVITEVRYDSDHSRIVQVKRRVDNGETLGEPLIVARASIISSIKAGYSYVTAYINAGGNYSKGATVFIVKIDGEEFIKTESNTTKKDNLGDLPEF